MEDLKIPVYLKAEELCKLTQTITGIISEGHEFSSIGELMMANAYLIPAKIAGAEGGGLYGIRIDNATLVKLAARELLAQTNMLRVDNMVSEEYIQLLRKEIEEFRLLFLDWVKGFDKTNDYEDEWDFRKFMR